MRDFLLEMVKEAAKAAVTEVAKKVALHYVERWLGETKQKD